MSIVGTPRLMTADELLAMPDDGVERWLIRGELRENRKSDRNRRNPDHSGTMANVAGIIREWVRTVPLPRGKVYSGDVTFKLRPNADTLVGIDVAYNSADLRAKTPKGRKLVEGVPTLAVEILSPSDVHSDITEKVQEYLDAGVAVVWVVDPAFEVVGVFRSGRDPEFFNRGDELEGEAALPAFRVCVAELFD